MNRTKILPLLLATAIVFLNGCAALRGFAAAQHVRQEMMQDYVFPRSNQQTKADLAIFFGDNGWDFDMSEQIVIARRRNNNDSDRVRVVITPLDEMNTQVDFFNQGENSGRNDNLKLEFIRQVDPEYFAEIKSAADKAKLDAKSST